MTPPLLIGAAAGLVSATLFASATTGTPLALLLFYLTALPLFLTGFGWGPVPALAGALVGTVAAALFLGTLAAASYALSFGAPAAGLCHLALLSRQIPKDPSAPEPAEIEWYPVGRLVASAAIIAGLLAAILVAIIGYDLDSYRESIRSLLQENFAKDAERMGAPLSDEAIMQLAALLARALPAAFAMIWLGITLLNMWTAGRIAEASARGLRPWPQIDRMELPGYLLPLFAVALLLSFLPGLPGLLATGPAGALFFAYVLLGLAVIHAYTRGMSFRGVLLAAIYFGIFVFGWPAIVVAIIGVGEPMFRLRQRRAGESP